MKSVLGLSPVFSYSMAALLGLALWWGRGASSPESVETSYLCTLSGDHMAGCSPEWGFFGHRRLNRLAVFTLDPDMMPFFRGNLEYLTDHAVDPDKRRYATKHEAVRHYIDIDHWGERPFEVVPRNWAEALLWKAELLVISERGDTTHWLTDTIVRGDEQKVHLVSTQQGARTSFDLAAYRSYWYENLIPQYYEEEWWASPRALIELGMPADELDNGQARVQVIDHFSEYGILPYHLMKHQQKLTRAFREGKAGRILQLAAEMGHYIGDASVPLHTTENYNGQLTNQLGIHGFWESRIPELIADERFDLLVGKAEYIDNKREYFWEIVEGSHMLVDSVLSTEKRLSETYPADRQFCFEERLDITVRTQCAEYALAWNAAMDGMVEERFRLAIHAIGSSWYTAWIDAGQPDLKGMGFREELLGRVDSLERAYQQGENKGRPHDFE